MKTILALALSFACLSPALAADEHDHHAHTGAAVEQEPGARYEATDDLNVRMKKIVSEMKALRPKTAKTTGKNVERTVLDIFKTCKLEPKADAAVHPILADILKGAKQLQKGKETAGHETIHQALVKYQNTFTHKDWEALPH